MRLDPLRAAALQRAMEVRLQIYTTFPHLHDLSASVRPFCISTALTLLRRAKSAVRSFFSPIVHLPYPTGCGGILLHGRCRTPAYFFDVACQ